MDALCHRCFTRIFVRSRRTFASVATTQVASPAQLPTELQSNENVSSDAKIEIVSIKPPSPYQLAASIVISRPPMLTRDLSKLEKEFFFYQRRLDKRLALPFVRNFYFKPGTLAYDEWRAKRKDMNVYAPYKSGWEDELRIGAKIGDDENMDYDSLVKYTVSGEDISASDTEEEIAAKKIMDKPLPRETEADISGDVRSLNRKLSRTLYLLVRRGDRNEYAWKFPQASLVEKQNLRECAESILLKSCGRDMNYWMVGNVPIGYYNYKYPQSYKQQKGDTNTFLGKKVFFMKARIFAGRPNIVGNQARINDYQWLTKDEIQGVVEKDYWTAVRHMLVER